MTSDPKEIPDGTRLSEAEIAREGGLDDGDLSESDRESLGLRGREDDEDD